MSAADATQAFSHVGADGQARMVDVSAKPVTARSATARGVVTVSPECLAALNDRTVPKGDVLSVAKIAGILGAKRTAELIPLCHPLPLSQIEVELSLSQRGLEIEASVHTMERTGVEMEALTAVSIAALSVVDMVKSVDRSAVITEIRVVAKSGGRSGTWQES